MHPPILNSTPAGPSRRQWLSTMAGGFGMLGLASVLAEGQAASPAEDAANPFEPKQPHHLPKAKQVIFLFMGGGPSHVDTFDPKPILRQRHGQEMPASVLGTQRVTLMTRNQGHFQAAATPFRFRKVGQAGHDMSDLWVHLPRVADELTFIRSVHTEPINHDPAVMFMQTGRGQSGLPSMGSWCS